MLVNLQKGNSHSHFLRNPTFGVISTTEWLLRKLQTTGSEKDFLGFLVEKDGEVVGWTYSPV